ncbi:MAG: cyanophycin synthetase, partial [Candidatus Nanopelagicales bacterium]
GFSFQLHGPGGIQLDAGVALPGRFNIANAALALAMLNTAKVEAAATVQGVRACAGVPGRMEPIDAGQDFLALVDYAHTPDALTAALSSLARDVDGRLIVVMGCGGDRDPSKRFAMGQVAAQQADMVIVTDDNPRSESPRQIREAVLVGAHSGATGRSATVEEIAGRGAAIRRAVGLARGEDVVVVAGKGHEQGQEIDGHVYPFDDRVVLRDALIARKDVGGGVATSAADPEDHRGHQEEI